MKLSTCALEKIADYIVRNKKGRDIVIFFNDYGSRDVYGELGLPDIGKKNGLKPTKKEYAIKKLIDLSECNKLRVLLNNLVNDFKDEIPDLDKILNPEGFTIGELDGSYFIQGGIIFNESPVFNEAHFQNIQNRILKALDEAEVSIIIVMAWFTNDTLLQKLEEKQNQGIDIKIAVLDDGINRKHGVDLSRLQCVMIKKGSRGGLMHNKFCVIDNQVVITGSYNWSNNAEFKNDENITIENDPKQATKYSVEFKRLIS